mmetsp:Transcript_30122/g.30608  ORF Transcript_30122/g.30608 Transcript_30122/m.30608 type:complete len:362 (+) Transcript_30122:816-1901(+)
MLLLLKEKKEEKEGNILSEEIKERDEEKDEIEKDIETQSEEHVMDKHTASLSDLPPLNKPSQSSLSDIPSLLGEKEKTTVDTTDDTSSPTDLDTLYGFEKTDEIVSPKRSSGIPKDNMTDTSPTIIHLPLNPIEIENNRIIAFLTELLDNELVLHHIQGALQDPNFEGEFISEERLKAIDISRMRDISPSPSPSSGVGIGIEARGGSISMIPTTKQIQQLNKALFDRVTELLWSLHSLRHFGRPHSSSSAYTSIAPLSQRLVAQTLPLSGPYLLNHLKQHMCTHIPVKETPSESMTMTSSMTFLKPNQSDRTILDSVSHDIDILDNFSNEISANIQKLTDDIVDVILARCLVNTAESCAGI